MTDDKDQPSKLKIFVDYMKAELGDPELVKQAVADFNAADLQEHRNSFEARLEFGKQVAEQRLVAYRGIAEYGLQTLKWSFLLNAGAIAVLIGYLGATGKVPTTGAAAVAAGAPASLIKALWPFVAGCVSVSLAGAAGYFNFCYAEALMPSAHTLHNFTQPGARSWPLAGFQKEGETDKDFYKRFGYKATWSRNAAICFAIASSLFFVYGVYRVLAALT